MSGVVNSVVEVGTFGLVDDFTGVESAQDAAREAAGLQAQGAQAGIAEQRRQFDITQEQLAPFREAGASALEQQRILLGLGSSPQIDPNAERRAELQQQISAIPQSGGGGSGLVGMIGTAIDSRNQQRLEQLQSELSAIPAFTPEDRGSAQEQQAQAFAQLQESPGQRFLRERQQKALLRNQSAIGGLGGGNVRTALQEQAAGFAQQDLQNQFGRLGQLAGQGQAAGTSIGQFGAQTAGNIANLTQAGAEARASGILGAAQQESQFTNQLLNLGGQAAGAAMFSDERLKTDVKKIDSDEFGNIYEFKYINSDILYTGRMAQELQKIRPDAVSMHDSGFLQVTPEFAPEVIQCH